MKITIEMDDYDFADQVTVQTLRNAIECLDEEMDELLDLEALPPHRVQDFMDNIMFREALAITHNYFTPFEEHLEI